MAAQRWVQLIEQKDACRDRRGHGSTLLPWRVHDVGLLDNSMLYADLGLR